MSVISTIIERFRARFGGADDWLTEPEHIAARDLAVVELLVLAMFADGTSGTAERDAITEFAQSRPWPPESSAEHAVDTATARVRAASDAERGVAELIEDICIRLDHVDDQHFALDHLATLVEADGVITEAEVAFIEELRSQFGLPNPVE
jgi:uncharacterized tellurite resistance protein B-like protein